MKKILCINTSSSYLSIALFHGDRLVAEQHTAAERMMSSMIMPGIDQVLETGQTRLQDVDLFGVGLGPGSFTSLRVGMATVQGLLFSHPAPVVGISSLELIARQAVEGSPVYIPICTVTDARRGMVYAALWEMRGDTLVNLMPPSLLTLKELLPRLAPSLIWVGDGVRVLQNAILDHRLDGIASPDWQFVGQDLWEPRARSMITPVQERLQAGTLDDIRTLQPLYLYPQDCQVRR